MNFEDREVKNFAELITFESFHYILNGGISRFFKMRTTSLICMQYIYNL